MGDRIAYVEPQRCGPDHLVLILVGVRPRQTQLRFQALLEK